MAEPLPPLTAGAVVSGRFRLESHLGAGATSSVWRARDLELGRVVALKALLGSGVDPELAARFEREGTILGRLSHPNLVPVYASGNDGGRPYLVMELVDGKPFDRILQEGPLPVDDALGLAADVAAGLGAAHHAGVVHRDVKPANILCHHDGTPRLVDFGIARVGDLTAVTTASTVVGTAAYLAPEQARGEVPGPAADVYALGCVLHEALTGRPPFDGESALAVAYQHVHDIPEPPSAQRPEVPAAVDDVVQRSLAKSTAQRYATAAEMEADLRRLLAGAAPEAASAGATVAMAAVERRDTLAMPAVEGPRPVEIIDPAPLAGATGSGRQRWGLAAAAAGAVVLVGLVLAAFAAEPPPERPAGATTDPPVTTTVPLTTSSTVDEIDTGDEGDDEGDDRDDDQADPGRGQGKGKGKGNGKGDD